MNSGGILFRFKAISITIAVCAFFICLYSILVLFNKNNSYPTGNKGRLLTNSVRTQIEESLQKGCNKLESIDSDYRYCVVSLRGKVVFSSIKKYKSGSIINLKDFLEYDNKSSREFNGFVKYSAPLINNNQQAGTAVFLIPLDRFLDDSPQFSTFISLIPIIVGIFVIVALIVYSYVFMKNDILSPINSLHRSTRKILNGDFSDKIIYDYDTEIGLFCHDFEAMRDELKFSKERELAMKASEKELLACLSHDIKTPLTAISGYVSGIKDGIVKDRAGIENYCSVIINRVKMLNKLLEDILEHSKAELNKMDISFTEFYCRDFFQDILDDLEVEVGSKGLKFVKPLEIPNLLLNGDRKRISQLMYNLVSNSIKYSRETGEISIYFETDGRYLRTYVKDSGIGISASDIPYIFNKFFRGEKSRNQNIPGSGLGLSISKYIAEAHGGYIECIESKSTGTIFCFGLPL